jgi:hypothetical protein
MAKCIFLFIFFKKMENYIYFLLRILNTRRHNQYYCLKKKKKKRTDRSVLFFFLFFFSFLILYTIYVYSDNAVEIRPVYPVRLAPDLRPTRRRDPARAGEKTHTTDRRKYQCRPPIDEKHPLQKYPVRQE